MMGKAALRFRNKQYDPQTGLPDRTVKISKVYSKETGKLDHYSVRIEKLG